MTHGEALRDNDQQRLTIALLAVERALGTNYDNWCMGEELQTLMVTRGNQERMPLELPESVKHITDIAEHYVAFNTPYDSQPQATISTASIQWLKHLGIRRATETGHPIARELSIVKQYLVRSPEASYGYRFPTPDTHFGYILGLHSDIDPANW